MYDSPVVPHHIAIVMDGNGRWAKRRFLPRLAGHSKGGFASSLRTCVRAAGRFRPDRFAFSSENWNRPADEVSASWSSRDGPGPRGSQLKRMACSCTLSGAAKVCLPKWCGLAQAEAATADNHRLILNVCFNYGGRWDIAQAAAGLAAKGMPITEASLHAAMGMSHVPDPDLIIRTGGEMRISNFLLWQAAYSGCFR